MNVPYHVVTCELCGRELHDDDQEEWRVQVRNVDSISVGLLDVHVCTPCASRVADAVEALRKALV